MKKEIREEIKDMAPNLLDIGNQNPFSVPSMYFKKLEIVLSDELNTSQQSVPSNYFDILADEVLIKAKTKKPARIIPLYTKRWLVAVSFAVICVASYFTINTNDSIIENQSFVFDVELEEAFDYLADQDDLYISEVLELSEDELLEETDDELDEDDLDFLFDEVTLDDLDELL